MNKTYALSRTQMKFVSIILAVILLITLSGFPSYAGTAPPADYKKTEQLADNDMKDSYQKNYQLYPDSDDDNYMYKSAEWTDKDAGTAQIKIVTGAKAARDTTAVYVYTTCDQHGFSNSLAKSNIEYLLDHYDRVDVVAITSAYPSGISTYLDVENSKLTQWIRFSANKHFNMMVYEGLYDYLMDAVPGKETGTETQKRFPDAIYTSFDSRVTPADGDVSSDQLKKMDIGALLKKYDDEGRYFSLCACGAGDAKCMGVWGGNQNSLLPEYTTAMTESKRLRANLLALLLDPQTWTDMDTAQKQLWDGSTGFSVADKPDCLGIYKGPFPTDYHILNDNSPEGDYLYGESFEALDVPMICRLELSDTVNTIFEIKNITCSDQSVEINTNGNTVNVYTSTYDPSSTLELTIDVQLKDSTSDEYKNCWLDTNTGSAVTKVSVDGELKQIMSTDSPKIARPGKYHVTYDVAGDDKYGIPSDGKAPEDDNSPYSYKDKVTVMDDLTTDWTTSDGTPDGIPGAWSFTSWDKDDFEITEDTTIHGAWKFTPDTYKVTYVVNGDKKYGTPDDSTVPTDSTIYSYKDTVTVKDNLTTSQKYAIIDGKKVPGTWTFKSWDKESFVIIENTIITGAWYFVPDFAPGPAPKVGSLTVSKTVTGNAGDKSKAFSFTLTAKDTSLNGEYGDMNFRNGVATFKLKHGESVTAENLPAGTEFTVSEKNADGYTVTVNKNKGNKLSGTIAAGKESTAAFINHMTKHSPEGDDPDDQDNSDNHNNTNSQDDSPVPTGDSSAILGLFILMVLSLAAVVILVTYRRRT